jgi:hypothetical protein
LSRPFVEKMPRERSLSSTVVVARISVLLLFGLDAADRRR